MGKRLSIHLSDARYDEVRRLAELEGVTIGDWVRHALADECRRSPHRRVGEKLLAIREAAAHAFPAPDIDRMLAEIAAGHGTPRHA